MKFKVSNKNIFSEIDNLRELGHELSEPTAEQLKDIKSAIEQEDYSDISELLSYLHDLIFKHLAK